MMDEQLIIDTRTTEQLRKQIAELAQSYTPAWRFDTENPDIGSAIALIFANQMAGNIRRMNQILDKYHTEFVNLLGIALLPADPATGIVSFHLIRETVDGINLPQGTRLMAQPVGEARPLLFETESDLYITKAKLSDIISISGHFGKIIPIMGELCTRQIMPLPLLSVPPQETPQLAPAFSLFDFEPEGVGKNLLFIYHKNIFNTTAHAALSVRIKGQETSGFSVDALLDTNHYLWRFYNGESLEPCKVYANADGSIGLCPTGEVAKLMAESADYAVLCLEHVGAVTEEISVTDIALSARCPEEPPTFVCFNNEELDLGDTHSSVLPFGDTAALFDEFYMGHNEIFAQAGAVISLSFHVSYREKLITPTPKEEAEELKIIKRRTVRQQVNPVQAAVQQISIEYHNGIGWKRLAMNGNFANMFDGTVEGELTLTFVCPEDWKPTVASGYHMRCLRMAVTRAENCYMQPCIHKMPVLRGLRLGYRYEQWKSPQLLNAVSGTAVKNLLPALASGKPFAVFSPFSFSGNTLYLGFDTQMAGSPVSILFDIAESNQFDRAPMGFVYSTLNGWKPLKVVDGTNHMTSAGMVVFMPPSDFSVQQVEGVSRYWIRIVDQTNAFYRTDRHHPLIRSIHLNTVEIKNVETLGEESFYVQNATPNMSFALAAENILSAEVFVNEFGRISQPEILHMTHDSSHMVRIEQDFLGGIRSFYVKWQEVENFDSSSAEDRHYVIDRMNNHILFGDGLRGMIPPAGQDVSFTVQIKCCKGEKANLTAGESFHLFDTVLYIDRIDNPLPPHAGSSIESLASAHKRGANIINGRNRLVTERDYTREVMSFSGSIQKVRCISGCDAEGTVCPGVVTIAVLMNDYVNGAHSFHSIQERLRKRLLEKSEATILSAHLVITEPFFIEISVEVWAKAEDASRSFALQNIVQSSIADFLDPLGNSNWNIGDLPTETQLKILLQSLWETVNLIRFVAHARYIDSKGVHETTLDHLPKNPLAIAVSGNHRVYVELAVT